MAVIMAQAADTFLGIQGDVWDARFELPVKLTTRDPHQPLGSLPSP
jgi:uncharacterized membrane protein YjdF